MQLISFSISFSRSSDFSIWNIFIKLSPPIIISFVVLFMEYTNSPVATEFVVNLSSFVF